LAHFHNRYEIKRYAPETAMVPIIGILSRLESQETYERLVTVVSAIMVDIHASSNKQAGEFVWSSLTSEQANYCDIKDPIFAHHLFNNLPEREHALISERISQGLPPSRAEFLLEYFHSPDAVAFTRSSKGLSLSSYEYPIFVIPFSFFMN